MKLTEIYNDEFDAMNDRSDAKGDFYGDQAKQHMLDMVEEYLFSHTHHPKIQRAIDGLEADQLEKVKGMLLAIAEENYDYSTDEGGEINIPEEEIVHALRQMRLL
jgi:hypothetical protein